MNNQYGQTGGRFGFALFPPFIKFLLVSNVVIYLIEIFLFRFYSIDGSSLSVIFRQLFALQPVDSNFAGSATFYPWQLLSYQFLHDLNGIWHLFFNMFGLWMFGMELENHWGSVKFATFYLLAGMGAGLLQTFIADVPTVGASGSIYGVFVAFAMMFPHRKIFMFPLFIPISAWLFVIFLILIDLFSGLFSSGSGVAHFAHLAGGLTGFLLIRFGKQLKIFQLTEKWFGKKGKQRVDRYDSDSYEMGSYKTQHTNVYKMNWQEKEERVQAFREPEPSTEQAKKSYIIAGEEITQSKIDAILDKISAIGYQNLSEKEKNILNELSKKI